LIVIVAVNLAGEGQFVFQDHQRFVGDHGDGKQIVAHFISLKKD
jgi:hypothetical protein